MFTKCPNPVMQINYISCWILSSLERKFQYNNNIPGVEGYFLSQHQLLRPFPWRSIIAILCFLVQHVTANPRLYNIIYQVLQWNSLCFLFCEIRILKHEWPFEVALCSLIFGHNYVIFIDFLLLLNVLVEHFYTWLHTVLLINDLHII